MCAFRLCTRSPLGASSSSSCSQSRVAARPPPPPPERRPRKHTSESEQSGSSPSVSEQTAPPRARARAPRNDDSQQAQATATREPSYVAKSSAKNTDCVRSSARALRVAWLPTSPSVCRQAAAIRRDIEPRAVGSRATDRHVPKAGKALRTRGAQQSAPTTTRPTTRSRVTQLAARARRDLLCRRARTSERPTADRVCARTHRRCERRETQ